MSVLYKDIRYVGKEFGTETEGRKSEENHLKI